MINFQMQISLAVLNYFNNAVLATTGAIREPSSETPYEVLGQEDLPSFML